jgi:hypothetical protein
MLKNRKDQEGMALMLALIAMLLIIGAVAVVSMNVQRADKGTQFAVDGVALDEACKAGIDWGIQRVWNQYILTVGNTTGNLASYTMFIDNVANNNEDENFNGSQDTDEYDWNGDGNFQVNAPTYLVENGAPAVLPVGSAQVVSIMLNRRDDITGTNLTFMVTARAQDTTRHAQQTIRIGGERFNGFQYAVLANNINCILCHAEFRSLDLERNGTNSANYGSFDRIKIASLESLMIRNASTNVNDTGCAASAVAGTMYTRGRVYNQNGTLLTNAQIASAVFDSYKFSNVNGKITQDSGGNLTKQDLVAAAVDGQGKPSQFANLYTNYPKDRTKMTDGELPEKFPAPFPDDNGNREVDDAEFTKYINSANGSISFELPPSAVTGTIKAGVAYGVPTGQTYAENTLPTASNGALSQLSSDGAYEGNLFLIGTKDDPIVIEDKVAVNGDVVIKGPIKGKGQLMVRGNAYVVGDITYDDAAGKFGQADDGAENAFALEAGGSILMGDYLTIRAKNDYTNAANTTLNTDIWQGKFIDVSKETLQATMTNGKKTNIGYFDAGVADAGVSQGLEAQYSFTTAELTLFNRMERMKWAPPGHVDYNATYYQAGYTPRYYRLKEGAPIYQYVTSKVTNSDLKEHAVNYNSPGVEVIPETDLANAAVHTLNPSASWLSETQLRKFWFADEADRRARADSNPYKTNGGNPWRMDGLLYTNNCIFGVMRGNGRHKSDTYGTLIVRGGIVCADLGMLINDTNDKVNTGLRLGYDKRVDGFLNVEDPTRLAFSRLAFRLLDTLPAGI